MTEERLPSKFAFILHADIAGSTVLVQQDEELAHKRIRDTFRRFGDIITKYHGHVRELRGDALLAEFERASDAVTAALAFQTDQSNYLAQVSDDIRPTVRVGIAMGEVIIADGTVTGGGVVLAQRVEQIAEPGDVCITGAIHEALPQRLPFTQESRGEQQVKGFGEPIRVYGVALTQGETIPPPGQESQKKATSGWGMKAVGLAAFVLLIVGGVAFWLKPWIAQDESASIGRPVSPLPDKPSIVVLPFDNMSSDPEQDYFADGITEDITTHLSKIRKLFVISRNSAFSYKGKNFRAEQIAGELGVGYLLEGSVRRAANQVRVNAQLIDGTTGSHLWAEVYDGTLEDIFGVQDKITSQIVEALRIQLTDNEQQRVYEAETKSLDAYDAYLKGWNYYLKNTSEDLPRARDYFEKAVEFDSEYNRAYAALAAVYYKATSEGWFTLRVDDWAMKRRLIQYLERAMLEPNSLALIVAARIEVQKGQHASAINYVKTAIDLEPNNAQAHTVLSKALIFEGRHDEALTNLEIAMQLDPNNISEPLGLAGLAQFLIGEAEVAIKLLEKSRTLHPERSTAGAEVTLTAAYAQLGRKGDAKRSAETMKKLWEDFFWRKPRITDIMTHFPFSRAHDARHLSENLLLAGVCCAQDVENVLQNKKE